MLLKKNIPDSAAFKGNTSFLFALLWKLWGPEVITGQYHEDSAIPAAFISLGISEGERMDGNNGCS